MARRAQTHRANRAAAFAAILAVVCALFCFGCSSGDSAAGASFSAKSSVDTVNFNDSAAEGANEALIDTSQVSRGAVGVSVTNSEHIKFQIASGQYTETFDIPGDGTPTWCPLAYGSGSYTFSVMQNTSGNNYVELYSTSANVSLESEFAPFLLPNVFCNYTEDSACVSKARELVSNASNQAEAVKAICNWVVENVSYDDVKASSLKTSTGYIPDPDETLSSGTGICFDYASLGAAMLRSQGIPTKIVTGYVSPGNIYHSWIMVYIDGTWKSAQFNVTSNTWSRVDLTFAASSDNKNVGDGKSYTDRYVY